MEQKSIADRLRESIEALAGNPDQSPAEALDLLQELEQEQERLRNEIKRLKLEAARRVASSGTMNSRLKDALRE